jgi:hypothetical protein
VVASGPGLPRKTHQAMCGLRARGLQRQWMDGFFFNRVDEWIAAEPRRERALSPEQDEPAKM